jgi:hypothetical protein
MRRRYQFSRWVRRVAGDFGRPEPQAAAGLNTLAGDIVWGIFVFIVLVLAVLLAWLLPASAAQYAIAILLGVAIGTSMLLWIPDKLLLTAVGGVLGVALSDLTGTAETIQNAAIAINKIVSTVNQAGGGDIAIRPLAAWLLLGIIVLCCLPAYRSQ